MYCGHYTSIPYEFVQLLALMTQIYNIRSVIWSVRHLGGPFHPKFGGLKTSKFRRDFAQREYLRDATRHRQSENGVANYGHSRTGKLSIADVMGASQRLLCPNLIRFYFGPSQTTKNRTGVLIHPTGRHQAGICHASSSC